MLKATVLLFVLFSTTFAFRIQQKTAKQNYCYATDDKPYKLLGTKTAYEFSHGDEDSNEALTGCRPVQFWSLNRHGTRLPGKKTIKRLRNLPETQQQIINNYKNEVPNTKINGLCEEDIQLLTNWVWNNSITEDNASTLTAEGWDELRNIARRNERSFPELMGFEYSENNFLFRFTRKERTNSSFKAYAEGLFGTYSNINAISFENDTLIETYKHCKRWSEEVEDNPASYVEYNAFKDSRIYQDMIASISERLGFKYNLDSDLITDFYDMCRFEQAWTPYRRSPWCSVLTKEDLLVLEYAEDLLYYYSEGHGMELNRQMGCMPLQDMMRRFENVVNGVPSEPKSVHYFTHSSALQLLMASMEMKKDKIAPTANNMNEQRNRVWRTSLIGSFATNINAVLYRCTDGDENRVGFYLNEHRYEYPGCPNGVCSWELVKEMFSDQAENCSMDFCNNDQ